MYAHEHSKARHARAQKRDCTGKIDCIVIPTRNRPPCLARCLTTLLANQQLFHHEADVIISDASTESIYVIENEHIVSTFARHYPSRARLVGSKETFLLKEHLAGAGLDRRTIEFCLGGAPFNEICNAGANRNILLLASAGKSFLSVDDDMEFVFTEAAKLTGQLRSRSSSVQRFAYPDRESMVNAASLGAFDLVSAHQQFLGLSGTILAKPRCRIADRDSTQTKLNLGLTFSGSIGDCGWGTPSRYLFLDEISSKKLFASDEEYLASVTTREVAQLSMVPLVTRVSGDIMTGAFAVHKSVLLPPFLPAGRGEDVLMGTILRRIDQHLAFVHLPHAMLHNPGPRRRFTRGEILRSAATTDLVSLLCGLIDDVKTFGGAGPEAHLRTLGRSLKLTACAPSFAELIRHCRAVRVQQIASLFSKRMAGFRNVSHLYVDDLAAYVAKMSDADYSAEAAVPVELLYGRSVAEAMERTRQLVYDFGCLMEDWVSIIDKSVAFCLQQ